MMKYSQQPSRPPPKNAEESCNEDLAAARAAFELAYPDRQVLELRDLGTEGDTRCVAIVYETPEPTLPLPYKLFIVNRGTAREADVKENPRYAIRGRNRWGK